MGDKKLSHKMIDLGFFSALGTIEHVGGNSGEGRYIRLGTPNTYDLNNGVAVVYDEVGRPWIMNGLHLPREIDDIISQHSLVRGAYVPHSNDGGRFVLKTMPRL